MKTVRSISDLHAAYRDGDTDPDRVIQECLDEIEGRDRGDDGIRAFIRVIERGAVMHGSRRDSGRPQDALLGPGRPGDARRPLEGVPIAVKDNIDTVDLGCSAGSELLVDVPVEADAPLVGSLRDAGAVIVGKSNLSEWANFRSKRSSSGWSSAGGQTLNPRHPHRTPCGSSSGSASAVAAGFVPAAIGTETDGSIICPAATQGLVGFKPTVGRVSTTGIVPISWSQDTAGPIATNVRDAWLVQKVLEGAPRVPLEEADLTETTIGVYPPGERVHQEVEALFARATSRLKEAGATIVPIQPVTASAEIEHAEEIVLHYEFPRALERYLRERRPRCRWKTLADLFAANEKRATSILTHFDQEIWERCLSDGKLTDAAYNQACALIEKEARQRVFGGWFDSGELDAIIAPANGPAWLIDHVNGDNYTGSATPPAAAVGYPVLTVPMGSVRALPIGLAFFGPAHSDDHLFRVALSWEHLSAA